MFTSDHCAGCGVFLPVEQAVVYFDDGTVFCTKCKERAEKNQQAENKERP